MQQQNKAAITALTAETPSHVKGSTTLSPVTWLFSRIFLPKRILRLYVLLGRPQRSTESMPAEPGKQCAPIRELPSPGWQVKEECTQSQPQEGTHCKQRETASLKSQRETWVWPSKQGYNILGERHFSAEHALDEDRGAPRRTRWSTNWPRTLFATSAVTTPVIAC